MAVPIGAVVALVNGNGGTVVERLEEVLIPPVALTGPKDVVFESGYGALVVGRPDEGTLPPVVTVEFGSGYGGLVVGRPDEGPIEPVPAGKDVAFVKG